MSSQSFQDLCANFYNAQFDTLGVFLSVHENLLEINGKQPHEIASRLKQVASVPVASKPMMAPGGFALPPALNGMMPGLSSSLGASAPPAAKPTARRTSAKTAAQVWLDVVAYREAVNAGNQALCAFQSFRGANKDKVCAGPAINVGQVGDLRDLRCAACNGKDEAKKNHKSIPAFGVVAQAPGVAPQIGFSQTATAPRPLGISMPTLPAAGPKMSGLPGMSSLPGLPGLQGLPSVPLPGMSSLPGLPSVSLPSVPSGLPGLPSVPLPGMSSLPGLPSVPLPGMSSLPGLPSVPSSLPGLPVRPSSPIQVVAAPKPDLEVIVNSEFQGGFPTDEKYRNLAVVQVEDAFACLGRLVLPNGEAVTATCSLTGAQFVPPTEDDLQFMKLHEIAYTPQ
jgi:hypothetical protein